MLGADLGARLATQPWVTATFQMALFGIAMLLAAGLMIRRAAKPEPALKLGSMKSSTNPLSASIAGYG